MMTREAFLGGERYTCDDCGAVLQENSYPTTRTSTSAQSFLIEHGEQAARENGIIFSEFKPCACVKVTL